MGASFAPGKRSKDGSAGPLALIVTNSVFRRAELARHGRIVRRHLPARRADGPETAIHRILTPHPILTSCSGHITMPQMEGIEKPRNESCQSHPDARIVMVSSVVSL